MCFYNPINVYKHALGVVGAGGWNLSDIGFCVISDIGLLG